MIALQNAVLHMAQKVVPFSIFFQKWLQVMIVPMVNQIYHLEFERAPSHVRLSLGSSGGKVYY